MPGKTREQIWADWVAKENDGNLTEMLNAQLEDAKLQTLAQQLSNELELLKKRPRF